jgi:hypothetical protein
MPSGGARARSGPPPDPNALRRAGDAADWTRLPAAGCDLPVPDWPLPTASKRERDVWSVLWAKPQAVMWHRNHLVHEVAIYCRRLVESEARKAPASLGTLVRQMADGLGLSVPGMRANRWVIEGGDDDQALAAAGDAPVRRPARERFRVVQGSG